MNESGDDEQQGTSDETATVVEVEPLVHHSQISRPLTESQVEDQEKKFGKNVIVTTKNVTWYSILFAAVFHPFNVLLGILAASSGILGDINATVVMLVMVVISILIRFIQEWKSAKEAQSLKQLVSNTVAVTRYWPAEGGIEEDDSVSSMSSLIDNDTEVAGAMTGPEISTKEILIEDVVPGDWVKLSAGDLIPADVILIKTKDLFISQSSLTGEAIPVEKFASTQTQRRGSEMVVTIPNAAIMVAYQQGPSTNKIKSLRTSLTIFFRNLVGLRVEHLRDINTSIKAEMDNPSFCYMGTSVVSGTATAIVRFTGNRTYFGIMALELAKQKPYNAFQLGVRRISWIFFLTMICLVPPIFCLQGFLHPSNSIYDAALFALAAAVGLTPEMLPMIVSSTLARGAFLMSKKKCIVKNLDSIINMGGMDVLCTDKTGTLTQNRVTLTQHLDSYGNSSLFPIQLAFLNSHFQTGLSNLMDVAVVDFFREQLTNSRARVPRMAAHYQKLDEIPFDFVRRRMSVLLKSKTDRTLNVLVTKGAVDEMLSNCSSVYLDEEDGTATTEAPAADEMMSPRLARTEELSDQVRERIVALNNNLNENGLRAIAVAYKIMAEAPPTLQVPHESELTFAGFIAFQDPPKASAKSAIRTLMEHNVQIKILTGDSALVTQKICEEIMLPVTGIVTTTDLEEATDEQICKLAESATIFAKLTPLQKAQVVRALKYNDHVVGFLGDGINDANALIEADIGISVDNGTDIARDSAEIILLEKDLNVVADGVKFGRQTYGNTMKYLVMAISSNFGNAFSLVVASAWFPFTPILPIQLLIQNLLYDVSQSALPWDVIDNEFLLTPHRWSMRSVLKFMICIGPISSIFDVTFFCYMVFVYKIAGREDDVGLFRTTWFTIGIGTQVLVVHFLRTPKLPFIQSRASLPVTIMSFVIFVIGLTLPWIPYISEALEFVQIPGKIYPFIVAELVAYCLTVQIVKIIYIACFKEWF